MNLGKYEKPIEIQIEDIHLKAFIAIPADSKGIILFAHGSGSGRYSSRNNFVADFLQKSKLATVLIDLLTEQEDEDYQNRFNINLLTERLEGIVEWLQTNILTDNLPIALFGASTGAAAALNCAAHLQKDIKAVVSRGGRPDLVIPVLSQVVSPTLLIVGGNDPPVIEFNKQAYAHLNCTKEFVIVPGASHLFEEPGTLEEVAKEARKWFVQYIGNNKTSIASTEELEQS